MSRSICVLIVTLAVLGCVVGTEGQVHSRRNGFRHFVNDQEIDLELTVAKRFACTVCASLVGATTVPKDFDHSSHVEGVLPKLMRVTEAREEERNALREAALFITHEPHHCRDICPRDAQGRVKNVKSRVLTEAAKNSPFAGLGGNWTGTPEPFILFPGLDAQELEAKLTRAKPPHFFCDKTTKDYFVIWIELSMLIPGFNDCFFSDMSLTYSIENNLFSNNTGVDLRARTGTNFGDVQGVLGFNILGKKIPMYATIFNQLALYGFKVGTTIFAAPYDFRLDPPHMASQTEFYNNVTALVEKAYALNNGAKVHLVGHSYGCSVGIYYLRHQVQQAWKDKYVASWFSFSGPYLGSTVSPPVSLSGQFPGALHNGGLSIRASGLANLLQNWGVGIYLFPAPGFYGNDTLISIAEKNYTAATLGQAFADLGFKVTPAIHKALVPAMVETTAPNVTVHCVNGVNVPTLYHAHFNTTDVGKAGNSYIVKNTTGDGVVPARSLAVCPGWKGQQSYNVTEVSVPGMQHGTGPWIPQVFAYWVSVMGVTITSDGQHE